MSEFESRKAFFNKNKLKIIQWKYNVFYTTWISFVLKTFPAKCHTLWQVIKIWKKNFLQEKLWQIEINSLRAVKNFTFHLSHPFTGYQTEFFKIFSIFRFSQLFLPTDSFKNVIICDILWHPVTNCDIRWKICENDGDSSLETPL